MSKPSELFLRAWQEHGRGKIPARELQFSPTRKFRFDFAWPKAKVAVEIDGFGGGHQTAFKLSRDHEKSNHALELGWIVVRFTSRQLGSKAKRKEAIQQLLRILDTR